MSDEHFLLLAPELKEAIFSHLPDVSCLLSVTLTCSSFLYTILEVGHTILPKILQSRLHPSVAFDALAAFDASKLGPTELTWSPQRVRQIMAMYDGDRSASWSRIWTFQDAFALEKLANHVEFFTQEFVILTLSVHPASALPGRQVVSDMPPSAEEVGRIQRTFYRFELYCNLFRKRQPVGRRGARGQLILNEPMEILGVHEQHLLFFEKFATWENEQLACVRDFLLGRFSIPFNEVAEHDIEWGELGLQSIDDEEPHEFTPMERYLVRGLAFLRRVINAPDYDVRYNLLDFKTYRETLSLYDGLMHQPGYESTRLMDWSSKSRAEVLERFDAADTDTGPKDAWLWAHETCSSSQLYNDPYNGHAFLRRCGYVIWDSTRWRQWRLLDTPWEDWEDCQLLQEDQNRHSNVDRFKMQESLDRRSKIWRMGGRGWWALSDESKVIWPEGRPLNRGLQMMSGRRVR